MASLHNVFPPSTPSLLSVRPPGADVQEVAHAIGMDRRIGNPSYSHQLDSEVRVFKRYLELVYLCLPEVAAYWNQVVLMNDYEKKCFALKMIEKMFNIIAGEKIVILGFCIPEGYRIYM
jgi:UDPglucose 6-dehydrogenase